MRSTVTWLAWGLAGAFFTFVALPLASSSPYPTPSRQEWTGAQTAAQSVRITPAPAPETPVQMALASASSFTLASASSAPAAADRIAPDAVSVPLVNTVRTLSIRRPIGDAAEIETPAEPRIKTASLGGAPVGEPPYEQQRPAAAPDLPDEVVATAPAEHPTAEPSRPRGNGIMNEVDDYLWEVYQRQPEKRDRGGDFTWKDPAAAKRVGKSLQAYVIQGMDADLREVLYHAGKAMDAEGIEWTVVSAFRDDWRQSIAAGLKARTGYSRHGGSRATGGYGHGLAVDVGHSDRSKSHIVFRWMDVNGSKYGLSRPIRHFDPPHVEPRGDWRRIAASLRKDRAGTAVVADRPPVENARPARAGKSATRYSRRSWRGRRAR
jgi:hypothetical protein